MFEMNEGNRVVEKTDTAAQHDGRGGGGRRGKRRTEEEEMRARSDENHVPYIRKRRRSNGKMSFTCSDMQKYKTFPLHPKKRGKFKKVLYRLFVYFSPSTAFRLQLRFSRASEEPPCRSSFISDVAADQCRKTQSSMVFQRTSIPHA